MIHFEVGDIVEVFGNSKGWINYTCNRAKIVSPPSNPTSNSPAYYYKEINDKGEFIREYNYAHPDDMRLIKDNKINNMTKLNNMMKRLLDADTKKLIQAGLINGDLLLTEEGKQAIFAIILEANKKELVKLAEEIIEEEKKK